MAAYGERVSVIVEEGPSSMQEIWPYNRSKGCLSVAFFFAGLATFKASKSVLFLS
jgi:hypothetical protein